MANNCVFVFAGTSEGREFALSFVRRAATPCRLRVYTATAYGAELLNDAVHAAKERAVTIEAFSGRLDGAALYAEFEQHKPGFVVDCTHPHAREITKNLKAAAARTGTVYLRLKRAETESLTYNDAVWVDTLDEAAAWLGGREGAILLTTGSRELAPFTGSQFSGRVFVRVLPVEESIAHCRAHGFSPARIIAMQGPFSETLNIALLREINAAYLVTKESGKTGGFDEKLSAAAKTGTRVIIVRRPREADALSLDDILDLVCDC